MRLTDCFACPDPPGLYPRCSNSNLIRPDSQKEFPISYICLDLFDSDFQSLFTCILPSHRICLVLGNVGIGGIVGHVWTQQLGMKFKTSGHLRKTSTLKIIFIITISYKIHKIKSNVGIYLSLLWILWILSSFSTQPHIPSQPKQHNKYIKKQRTSWTSTKHLKNLKAW